MNRPPLFNQPQRDLFAPDRRPLGWNVPSNTFQNDPTGFCTSQTNTFQKSPTGESTARFNPFQYFMVSEADGWQGGVFHESTGELVARTVESWSGQWQLEQTLEAFANREWVKLLHDQQAAVPAWLAMKASVSQHWSDRLRSAA